MTQQKVAASWDELPTEVQILLNMAGIWADHQRRMRDLRQTDLKGLRDRGGSVDLTLDQALKADSELENATLAVADLRRRWGQREEGR